MKNKLILIFILFSTISYGQKKQTGINTDIDFGAGIVLTSYLNVKQNNSKIVFTSPKNADLRIFGKTKGYLARILGKAPKKGILMTIKTQLINDSLIGNLKIPMFGKLKFKGVYKNGMLNGEMLKNDTLVIGTVQGVVGEKRKIDYNHLYPKIIRLTKENIFSKSVLKDKKWKNNTKKIRRLLNNVQDDIELYIGFNMLGYKMPFSHYSIFIQENENADGSDEIDGNTEPTVLFKEINTNIAYLQIKNFTTSQKELSVELPKIIKNNYKNLILDLRDNGGGGLEAAFELSKHLYNKKTVVGYFVTNKLQYSGFNLELFDKLPIVKMQSTKEFISSLQKGKGSKLVFGKNNNSIFSGNLYILTNGYTASTCEPIVYILKETKRATIIGENTMGAMLSATFFDIDGKYKLFLPIADFYTFDGVRLEGIGVAPNIKTKSDDALNKAISLIQK